MGQMLMRKLCGHWLKTETCSQRFSHSEEEIRIFNAIMELRPKFRAVVDATRNKADHFLLFVKKVCSKGSVYT